MYYIWSMTASQNYAITKAHTIELQTQTKTCRCINSRKTWLHLKTTKTTPKSSTIQHFHTWTVQEFEQDETGHKCMGMT